MTTLGSNIYPTRTGGEIVSKVILIIGIGFVALLGGAFAQGFPGPEIAGLEAELEAESLSAEAMIPLRELRNFRGQLEALQIVVEGIVEDRAGRSGAPISPLGRRGRRPCSPAPSSPGDRAGS
jgi:hypothetical protein